MTGFRSHTLGHLRVPEAESARLAQLRCPLPRHRPRPQPAQRLLQRPHESGIVRHQPPQVGRLHARHRPVHRLVAAVLRAQGRRGHM